VNRDLCLNKIEAKQAEDLILFRAFRRTIEFVPARLSADPLHRLSLSLSHSLSSDCAWQQVERLDGDGRVSRSSTKSRQTPD
jgi:hypothetical protein